MGAKKFSRFILISCLLVYLFLVCWVLFINAGHTDRSTYFVNPDDNFLPFQGTAGLIKMARRYNFEGYYLNMLIRNVLGNFFLLFPLGIMGPLLFPKLASIRNIALTAFVFSFMAESTQFIFSLGIFDTDDIILNTIGAVAGFVFIRWLVRFYQGYSVWGKKTVPAENNGE